MSSLGWSSAEGSRVASMRRACSNGSGGSGASDACFWSSRSCTRSAESTDRSAPIFARAMRATVSRFDAATWAGVRPVLVFLFTESGP